MQNKIFQTPKSVIYTFIVFMSVLLLATAVGAFIIIIFYAPTAILNTNEAWKWAIIISPFLPLIIIYSYMRTYFIIKIIDKKLEFSGLLVKKIIISPQEITNIKPLLPYLSVHPTLGFSNPSILIFMFTNHQKIQVFNNLKGMNELLDYIKSNNTNVKISNEWAINP